MLESIEELNELSEDPKLTLAPSVLDSIEELDNIMQNGFDPEGEENQTEDQEIFFKKDRPGKIRGDVLDEDTMPEFEFNRAHPTPQTDKVAVDEPQYPAGTGSPASPTGTPVVSPFGLMKLPGIRE